MFPYSDSNKRYHTLDYAYRKRFGCKTVKLSLDAGCTCPNRDGTKGFGGCSFCSPNGGGDFAGGYRSADYIYMENTIRCLPSITEQLEAEKQRLSQKWHVDSCIAYFQAHTNTYAPVEVMRPKLEEALQYESIVGMSIATRPDCLPIEWLEFLESLSKKTFLTVELGLQSISNQTGEQMNRCHSYQEFVEGYNALRNRGIRVCVHLINGLPGETKEMMITSAATVGKLCPDGVKLHLLHVLEGTVLAEKYRQGEFETLSREEYVNTVCDQVERLPAETVIERITGDGDRHLLLAPLWSRDKRSVLNAIDKELARRDSFQGMFYTC